MNDPIEAFELIQSSIKRYIVSAFNTNSPTFEVDRKQLLDTEGVLFQEPYVEPLPTYAEGKKLADLSHEDLPGMSVQASDAFKSIVGAGLFKEGYSLYLHQQRMLKAALDGKHCVVVTGTGSGKTESFLLPVIALIIREAMSERTKWTPASSPSNLRWTKNAPPTWNFSRRNQRGETRPAAIRTIVLYPMNALVEDQISRLRMALDSYGAHSAMDSKLGGNRIRFGRYNGTTPVSGHPVKADGSKNTRAHKELEKLLVDAIKESTSIQEKIDALQERLVLAQVSGDQILLQKIARELSDALEQVSFIPRMETGSAEMFHRWEMAEAPPDLLITNVSMLSIMLMRHKDPQLPNDRADSQMFDQTRDWLAGDKSRVFQLVVDELHLYRGASGTEVGYLIRLLLDRLGLKPDSPQLRILASSASLDVEDDRTFEFLGGFFGMEKDDAIKSFHVEAGELLNQSKNESAEMTREIADACFQFGGAIVGGRQDVEPSPIVELLRRQDRISDKIVAAFREESTQARALKSVSNKWFPFYKDCNDQQIATRGLLAALGSQPARELKLPRLRFHWMAKNVDGLWATAELNPVDNYRHVGRLFPEPALAVGDFRLLEVLYCECCGTQLLCGNKIEITPSQLNGNNNPLGLPGIGNGPPVAYELTALTTRIEGLPESNSVSRTDMQLYKDLGVIWLVPKDWRMNSPSDYEWEQGTEERDEHRKRLGTGNARWFPATINPKTGIVRLGGAINDTDINCLWFDARPEPTGLELPAMPQKCPSCLMNYSENAGRSSPIRSFVTGLGVMSHLLAKHLMAALPIEVRQLVAFSDSREAAASLAVGVEDLQWSHLFRVFLQREIRSRVSGDVDRIKQYVLNAIEAGEDEKAALLLEEAHSNLRHEEFDDVLRFNNLVEGAKKRPNFVTDDVRAEINRVRGYKLGYVRIEDILMTPNLSIDKEFKSIWRDLVTHGVNPAGAGIDHRILEHGENTRDWTSVFASRDGEIIPRLKDNSEAVLQDLRTLEHRLRKVSWRSLSGRLLYDLESQGLGYLCFSSVASYAPPSGMDQVKFVQVCNSLLRIIVQGSRTLPAQGPRDHDGWADTQPTDRVRSPVGRRVRNYIQAVATKNRIDPAILQDSICKAFKSENHLARDGGWGVARLDQLWVKVVEENSQPWECVQCSQIQWHASAGVCSRCFGILTELPNGERTAKEISHNHYYAREVSEPNSTFRIHT